MGEAAVKEPSMEDILSSIRKIISEEGSVPTVENTVETVHVPEPEVALEPASSPQMSEVLDQVRAEDPAPVAPSEGVSGNDAAKMAASLASIAESVKADIPIEPEMNDPAPTQSVWDEVSEPTQIMETVEATAEVEQMIEPQEAAPSLASIAGTVVEQVEIPATPEVDQIHQELEAEISHVEMAEAMPAPELSTAAVETLVEEEMAFKGALMSPSADGAVSGAFDRLKRSAMDDIDAKTEAILRPMLREWLDENLPNMVERLVREEIERVARGV